MNFILSNNTMLRMSYQFLERWSWQMLALGLALGCTISSGHRSNRSLPPSQQQPGPYMAPYSAPLQPAPNGAPPQPAPYGPPQQPPPQFNQPGPSGICAALGRRASTCPTESVTVNGCDHDERCLAGIGRPDAVPAIVDCINRSACNVAGNSIASFCSEAAKQRLPPTATGAQLASACSSVVARCQGGRVVDKCAGAYLLNDPVSQQVLMCLAIPDCDAKDRCIENLFDTRGCP